MRRQFNWREAVAEDNTALQAFACTQEAPRDGHGRPLPHPRRWERVVEAGLRKLHPPVGDGALLLGEDDGGRLGAVVLLHYGGPSGDTYVVKLVAFAVSLDHQGRRLSDEAIEIALRAAGDAGFTRGFSRVTVYGLVHVSNTFSRAACDRSILRSNGIDASGEYEEWAVELELPPEEAGSAR